MDNPMFWLGIAGLVLTLVTVLAGAAVFLWRVATQQAASSTTLDSSVKALNRAVNGLLEFQRESHEFQREAHGRLKLLEEESQRRQMRGTGT